MARYGDFFDEQASSRLRDSCTLYDSPRFVIECGHDRHEVACGRDFSDENANTVGDRYSRAVRSSWFDGLLR